jgi:nitrate/nitrite transport system substrate-binding protein
VFGVTEAWAEANPNGLQALLRALLKASTWLAQPGNRQEAAELLSRPQFVDAPAEVVRQSILGMPAYAPGQEPSRSSLFNYFFLHAATFPWVSHGAWAITQMLRWGQISEPVSIVGLATRIYRPDLYRQAAASLGISAPLDDLKIEGAHTESWHIAGSLGPIPMGPDAFFDGVRFDSARPLDYLAGFPLSRVKPALEALKAAALAD